MIHLTVHPGGAVAADGGVQPSDPVTDTGLVKFLRSALRKAEVFRYTVRGVREECGGGFGQGNAVARHAAVR